MPGETGPTLDDDGIPDLEGPLAEKERTGDPQEGLMAPGDHPHTSDWGITGEEERAGEPLDVRVRHERADLGATDPVDEVVADLGLDARSGENDDPADSIATAEGSNLIGRELVGDDLLADDESEVLADLTESDPLEGQSAEEAAVHIVSEDDL